MGESVGLYFKFIVYGLVTIGKDMKYVLYFDKRNQSHFSTLTLVC